MKKRNYLIIAICIVIVALIACGIFAFQGSDAGKVRNHLKLGHKYLNELNYEQALAEFERAIEIDGDNVEAYLGLADALEALARQEKEAGNIDQAIEYLNQLNEALKDGYQNTNDERLKSRLDEIQGLLNEWQKEKAAALEAELLEIEQEKQDQLWAEVEEAMEHLRKVEENHYSFPFGTVCSRTDDDTERLCRDSINVMQNYLDEMDEARKEKIDHSEFYNILSSAYYLTGELDKCMEIRKKGYEETGYASLEPAQHERDGYVFDKYDRIIYSSHDTVTIEREYSGNKLVRETSLDTNQPDSGYNVQESEYENGRISRVHSGNNYATNTYEFQYSEIGATAIQTTETSYGYYNETVWEFIFDEYGNVIDVNN